MRIKEFEEDVESIINILEIDKYFEIPDYILADYLANQLEVLDVLRNKSKEWYKVDINEELKEESK